MKTIYGADIEIGECLLNYINVAKDREAAKNNIDKALAGEKIVEESYAGDEQLSRRYFVISQCPIKNVKGEVIGVVIVSTDISERKKAEEALIESEANFIALINGMSDTVWVVGFDGNFVDVNDAAVKVLGIQGESCFLWDLKTLISI